MRVQSWAWSRDHPAAAARKDIKKRSSIVVEEESREGLRISNALVHGGFILPSPVYIIQGECVPGTAVLYR